MYVYLPNASGKTYSVPGRLVYMYTCTSGTCTCTFYSSQTTIATGSTSSTRYPGESELRGCAKTLCCGANETCATMAKNEFYRSPYNLRSGVPAAPGTTSPTFDQDLASSLLDDVSPLTLPGKKHSTAPRAPQRVVAPPPNPRHC